MLNLALAITAASLATPPCIPPAPNDCVAWQHVGRDYDVVIKSWTSTVTRTTRTGPWCTMPACYCNWYPCGQRPHNCTPISCNYSIQNQTCWSVGGGVTVTGNVQAGFNLIGRLLGALEVAVEVNGQLQKCYAYTQGVVITPHWSDCWKHMARDVWTEAKVYGWDDVAMVADYWDCQLPSGLIVTVRTECGVITWAGDAMNVENVIVQHTPYPCDVEPPIPGWSGPYSEACCKTPMPAPCDMNNLPGQIPCCGCYGAQ